MKNAVFLDHLHKEFVVLKGQWLRRQRVVATAVHDISLAVEGGEAVAFIGPNGAGKSTTIKMLTGILRPTSGRASVLGLSPFAERAKLAHSIAAVFGQRSQLWYHLPPRDTFDMLARIYNLERAVYQKRKDMLIERFSIGSFLDTPVRKLSLGQRMRAEIAASLLHQPKVLFLDEPTIGLNVVARQELRDLLRNWNKQEGMTVFLTSHDAGDIESVAERVVVINHGRIVLDDPVESVRRRFLSRKVVSVQFHHQLETFSIDGAKVLRAANYSLQLEVDTSKFAIEGVIQELLKIGAVADITIEDPPLEDVIAHIYGLNLDQCNVSANTG
jgi:ABC-2 type transport system ATP-binding protein